jgi:hypothetical protein
MPAVAMSRTKAHVVDSWLDQAGTEGVDVADLDAAPGNAPPEPSQDAPESPTDGGNGEVQSKEADGGEPKHT